jgi:uncharacterized protein YjgD (DUF1641 family)
MAKQIEFKKTPAHPAEALHRKLQAAPLDNAEAVLKVYELLNMAEKHGVLDILRGAISAENTIIEKAAGYANTPEGINIMRNVLVLGKVVASVDPDFLHDASKELTESVVAESRKQPSGLFGTMRRMFSGDALRGLCILIAGLESLGRTARKREQQ